MKAIFTQTYIHSLKAMEKSFWLTDAGFKNLRIYVGASGVKIWYVGYQGTDGRNKSHKIGSADVFTVTEARNKASVFLASIVRGEEPNKKTKDKIELGEFMEKFYAPWVVENRKTGKETMAILYSSFRSFFKQPIDELRKYEFEQWQIKRRNDGAKSATVNRLMTSLKAALNWGVDNEIIESNPLSRLKPLQEHDSDEKVRYLTADERERLMSALDEREERLREERNSHNKWLSVRGKKPLSLLDGGFADYLKPMVIISLNSGIRRGSLFALKWGDVDFNSNTITLRAATTKTGKNLRLPMNDTFINTLKTWRQQSENTAPDDLIFPSPKKKGAFMNNTKRSWEAVLKAAQIENFRWHDMRHDFASRLVMQGEELNTVRELLGHADMKMTLRYAHLAPEKLHRAVKLLDIKKGKNGRPPGPEGH